MAKENVIIKLSEREHLLARSGMYIGSSTSTVLNTLLLEDNKFKYLDIEYVPGLNKILNEIIDNSIDEHVRTNGEFSTKIEVNIDKEKFSVKDNGRGIPIKEVQTPEGTIIYQPELAWTHARAGSNFTDDANSSTIGTNGVGSMAASVFSKEFTGITCDGSKKCTVKCTNNNEKIKTTVTDYKGNNGTTVTLYPDLARFGLSEITDNHIKMIEQRLYNLSVAYPNITFTFNSKKIKLNDKKYLEMFGDNGVIEINDKYSIGIFNSDTEEFKHFTLMNGLSLTAGGTQIDYISNNIVYKLRDKIAKKYKTIKPGDVKQKLFIVITMKDFKNPKYETQTKEKLTSPTKDISDYFSDIDFDKLVNKIYANKSIIDPIIDYFRIKEEFKKKQELKSLDKQPKKITSEKFMSPIGDWNRIFICEGDCLEENTKILLSDGSSKTLADVSTNDYVVSGDGTIQKIKSKVKSIRESFKIITRYGSFSGSGKHRMYVYDVIDNKFIFIDIESIYKDKNRYKLLKSRINEDSQYIRIISNNRDSLTMEIDCGKITYTDNDFFVVLRNNGYIRLHAKDILPEDIIVTINN